MDYTKLASKETIIKTIEALKERGFEGMVASTKEEALAKIKELIPRDASIMNGSSRTLEEIGFIDHLKSGAHGWNNLHEAILIEKNTTKKSKLRKESVLSDYYLGSVHALAETGEMVIASNSGSQLPHLVFTSPNIILVVGAQKIVPTLIDAIHRVEEYALPLEDKRMKDLGYSGSQISKIVVLKRENAMMGRKVQVIIINEKLGF